MNELKQNSQGIPIQTSQTGNVTTQLSDSMERHLLSQSVNSDTHLSDINEINSNQEVSLSSKQSISGLVPHQCYTEVKTRNGIYIKTEEEKVLVHGSIVMVYGKNVIKLIGTNSNHKIQINECSSQSAESIVWCSFQDELLISFIDSNPANAQTQDGSGGLTSFLNVLNINQTQRYKVNVRLIKHLENGQFSIENICSSRLDSFLNFIFVSDQRGATPALTLTAVNFDQSQIFTTTVDQQNPNWQMAQLDQQVGSEQLYESTGGSPDKAKLGTMRILGCWVEQTDEVGAQNILLLNYGHREIQAFDLDTITMMSPKPICSFQMNTESNRLEIRSAFLQVQGRSRLTLVVVSQSQSNIIANKISSFDWFQSLDAKTANLCQQHELVFPRSQSLSQVRDQEQATILEASKHLNTIYLLVYHLKRLGIFALSPNFSLSQLLSSTQTTHINPLKPSIASIDLLKFHGQCIPIVALQEVLQHNMKSHFITNLELIEVDFNNIQNIEINDFNINTLLSNGNYMQVCTMILKKELNKLSKVNQYTFEKIGLVRDLVEQQQQSIKQEVVKLFALIQTNQTQQKQPCLRQIRELKMQLKGIESVYKSLLQRQIAKAKANQMQCRMNSMREQDTKDILNIQNIIDGVVYKLDLMLKLCQFIIETKFDQLALNHFTQVQNLFEIRQSDEQYQFIKSLSKDQSDADILQLKGYYTLSDMHSLLDHCQFKDREVPLHLIYYFVLDVELVTKRSLRNAFKAIFKGALNNDCINIVQIIHSIENVDLAPTVLYEQVAQLIKYSNKPSLQHQTVAKQFFVVLNKAVSLHCRHAAQGLGGTTSLLTICQLLIDTIVNNDAQFDSIHDDDSKIETFVNDLIYIYIIRQQREKEREDGFKQIFLKFARIFENRQDEKSRGAYRNIIQTIIQEVIINQRRTDLVHKYLKPPYITPMQQQIITLALQQHPEIVYLMQISSARYPNTAELTTAGALEKIDPFKLGELQKQKVNVIIESFKIQLHLGDASIIDTKVVDDEMNASASSSKASNESDLGKIGGFSYTKKVIKSESAPNGSAAKRSSQIRVFDQTVDMLLQQFV